MSTLGIFALDASNFLSYFVLIQNLKKDKSMKLFSFVSSFLMAASAFAIGTYDGEVFAHRCGPNTIASTHRELPTVCEVSVMKHSKGYKSGLVAYYYSAGKVTGYFYEATSLANCLPVNGSSQCSRQYTLVANVLGSQLLWGVSQSEKIDVITNERGNHKSLSATFVGTKFFTQNLEYIVPSP